MSLPCLSLLVQSLSYMILVRNSSFIPTDQNHLCFRFYFFQLASIALLHHFVSVSMQILACYTPLPFLCVRVYHCTSVFLLMFLFSILFHLAIQHTVALISNTFYFSVHPSVCWKCRYLLYHTFMYFRFLFLVMFVFPSTWCSCLLHF